MSIRDAATVFMSALCVQSAACTNAYRVDNPNYSQLADLKDGHFRITTHAGQSYVVRRFIVSGDSLVVLEGDRRPGYYDTDGVADPEPTFGIPVEEIKSIDEIRFDGKTSAIVSVLGLAAVGGLIAFIVAYTNGNVTVE